MAALLVAGHQPIADQAGQRVVGRRRRQPQPLGQLLHVQAVAGAGLPAQHEVPEPVVRRVVLRHLEAAEPAAEVRQRRALPRLGVLHRGQENPVGAARYHLDYPALDRRQRPGEQRDTGSPGADLDPGELVVVAAGEPLGEVALVLAQDVEREPTAAAHRLLRWAATVQASQEHRRVERQRGDRADCHPVAPPAVEGREDDDAAHEVADHLPEDGRVEGLSSPLPPCARLARRHVSYLPRQTVGDVSRSTPRVRGTHPAPKRTRCRGWRAEDERWGAGGRQAACHCATAMPVIHG